jgi:hypothetical protein
MKLAVDSWQLAVESCSILTTCEAATERVFGG